MLKITLKPHRKSLKSGTADAQKIFVMLKLIPEAEVAKARPPLALALVIDTSASMQSYADQDAAKQMATQQNTRGQQAKVDGGNYQSFQFNLPTLLDQAVQAAHMMVDDPRLDPTDTVSIIHFDDEARTLLPLTPISNKQAAHTAIESLRDFAGATFMAKGLQLALDQMNSLAPETAKRVFVLTDGATADEMDCLRILPQFGANNTPLIGIGFGEEYNEQLLTKMADATQGRPYHLRQMSDLMDEVLPAEIGQTAREVVTDLKAKLSMVKGVKVDSITRSHPSLAEVETTETPCRLGNISAGDYTIFIFELTLSGIERPPSRARVAQFGLTASAPGLHRVREFEPLDLFLEFTTDEAAIAAVDPEVIGYVQQKNVGRLVDDAMKTASLDAAGARQTLQIAAGMTQRLGNNAATQMLNNAMDELNATGQLSGGTYKTVALGLRTKTVKTASLDDDDTGGL